ncbi:uncharacterized protein LACBIDRAFT_302493 [Laccaria bicolor S238N-H82]|uniref:Predicted protein n=1 Tax=Laccaria bicolor (strain S238N-H82 / ATCC MYA-4686) TaxID=486041 RepID=B0DHS1_LACBS|nr:uncharacterized protein LACBIDRAFT_302493 [Laccaria bicolor S238N-H82]EDR05778.1 predicted protein [Laccaria bicolor S238N-H82]|eukprot:XP_001883454.1 predicted protein [Laccaria bicolor S238N-H82]
MLLQTSRMKIKARKDSGPKPKPMEYKPMLNDIIILVMGPSGVGKSTFINYLAGEDVVQVGHDLRSCTTQLQPIVVNPPPSILFRDRRLVLVDTPGFDDTFAAESEILNRIASWLAHVYSTDTKLGGLIYLYDISLPRMKGTTLRNLEVFKKLCGDRALRSVVLGTTKWAELASSSVGEQRVKELCDKYWLEMIECGSIVHNFGDTQQSAWDMVDSVLAYDVVIPVIGVTGVGKSLHEVVVGDDLQPCTDKVQPVIIDPILVNSRRASYHGRRVIVVDTPGFDSTFGDDSATLQKIVENLAARYGPDIKIGGIIHPHDVNRRPHHDFHNYLDKICELFIEPRMLILGTTMWGASDDARRVERERKLDSLTNHYWSKLIQDGAKVCRFTGSQDSAWMMVKAILDDRDHLHRTEVLQIQEELVGAKKLLPDTEAGQQLRHSLDQLLKTLKSKHSTDSLSIEMLNPAQIAGIRAQIKALHIPLSQRVLRFFDTGVDRIVSGLSQKNLHRKEAVLVSRSKNK